MPVPKRPEGVPIHRTTDGGLTALPARNWLRQFGRMISAPTVRTGGGVYRIRIGFRRIRTAFCRNRHACSLRRSEGIGSAPAVRTGDHVCVNTKRPAHGKTAHPSSNAYQTRYPRSQLRNGTLAAHAAIRLMLLGSPPDMVHGTALRKTKSSTPLTWVRRSNTHPQSGIHPCYSGLQATGHRWLPD